VHCLIYRSHATTLFERPELDQLLEQARSNNALADITGCLLYGGGNFLQLLEGPLEHVQATFGKIQRDDRHRELQVLLDAERSHRTFNAWWMAFFNLHADTPIPERLEQEFGASIAALDQNPMALHQLFDSFRAQMS